MTNRNRRASAFWLCHGCPGFRSIALCTCCSIIWGINFSTWENIHNYTTCSP